MKQPYNILSIYIMITNQWKNNGMHTAYVTYIGWMLYDQINTDF